MMSSPNGATETFACGENRTRSFAPPDGRGRHPYVLQFLAD
jgi:hypothetical protein